MINITLAKNAGFCFGVKRAIDIVEKLSESGKKIYTNGPIIHNPQVIENLSQKGICSINNIKKIRPDATLVIRTHGVKKNFYMTTPKDLKIVDATCPFVKRAQDIVKKLSSQSYCIVILGDKKHPEVEGLVSYTDKVSNKAIIVKDLKEIKKIKLPEKIGFLSQTTQSINEFKKIASYLKRKCKNASVFDTICRTTSERQNEVEKISKKSDIMMVAGGKNSANTKRLAAISRKNTKTHHIETAGELKKNWFKGKKIISVSAGASTPDWIINDVVEKIKSIYRGQTWKK